MDWVEKISQLDSCDTSLISAFLVLTLFFINLFCFLIVNSNTKILSFLSLVPSRKSKSPKIKDHHYLICKISSNPHLNLFKISKIKYHFHFFICIFSFSSLTFFFLPFTHWLTYPLLASNWFRLRVRSWRDLMSWGSTFYILSQDRGIKEKKKKI